MNNCLDCGRETQGVRCRIHNGAAQALEAAKLLADSDQELLHWRDEEKLSVQRISARLGVSPNRVYQRLREARRRQALLA